MENPDALLHEKMHCRVSIDIQISFEEANLIKETFIPQYNLRELMLIPEKEQIADNFEMGDITFESVDSIVIGQLNAIESESFDKKLLLDIYQNL